MAVFAVGLYDDTRPARSRGMLRQLRALAAGHVEPGAVKLVVIAAAAAVGAAMLRQTGVRYWLALATMAGAANLWNLLDVVPGRSLKWFLPVAGVLLAMAPRAGYSLFLAPATGAAVAVLPFDLRERGMLGDGGANLIGFVLGGAAVVRSGTLVLGAVVAAIVLLHLVAETVTLSRALRAVRPLRWWDDLGRILSTPGAA
jgi:UDP-N-acetylmuramyl pentapeptide phosphotransferase/UDP-N-acetylglucosamine-1-phosphate transferase